MGNPKCAILAVVILCSIATGTAIADDQLDGFFEIWKKREQDIRSVRIEWDELVKVRQGSLTAMVNVGLPNPRLQGKTLPPEDKVLKRKGRMLIDGEQFLCRRIGLCWDNIGGEFRSGVQGLSCDGSQVCSLSGPTIQLLSKKIGERFEGDVRPIAFLYSAKALRDFYHDYHLFPVTWTYRLMNPVMSGLDHKLLSVDRIDRVDDGQECVVLKRNGPPFNQPDRAYTIWVTNDGQAAVRRHEIIDDGTIRARLDVEYETTDQGQVIPKKWSILKARGGKTQEEMSVKVTRLELNPELRKEELTLPLSVGTHVVDETGSETVDYLIKEDNVKRLIAPEEMSVRHSILMKTETGEAVDESADEE